MNDIPVLQVEKGIYHLSNYCTCPVLGKVLISPQFLVQVTMLAVLEYDVDV